MPSPRSLPLRVTIPILLILLVLPHLQTPALAAWLATDGVPGVASATEVRALQVFDDGSGSALYAGGRFTAAGTQSVQGVTRWNGSNWTLVGELSAAGTVRCMTSWNGLLVVGGNFTSLGGTPTTNLAVWNGTSWSALGTGLSVGTVYAVAGYAGDLIVAGAFATAGGIPVNGIARWDGSAWHAMGTGFSSGQGQALTVFQGNLIVGGTFGDVGGAGALRIGSWNGTTWSALGGGLSNSVSSLAVFDRDGGGPEPPSLVAGGNLFSQASSQLARWDGASWGAFGGTFSTSGTSIQSLFTEGDTLVVGGTFQGVVGTAGTSRIARWTVGGGWASYASGFQPALAFASGEVLAVARFGALFAAGTTWNDGRVAMHGIARWDGGSWHALTSGMGGNAGAYIQALVPHAGGLAVGGVFASVGNGVNANNVALLTTSGWDTLGVGLGLEAEKDIEVHALLSRNDSLYAAYSGFSSSPVNRVDVWDGAAWTTLASTSLFVSDPYALAWHAGALHVGGAFTSIAGVGANRVARRDGAGWHALGGGLNAAVYALLSSGGDLIAGGQFTQADGAPASRVARWNGSAWSPMGAGLTGTVYSLVEHQGAVHAGCSNGVFRWDGANWISLGASGAVRALLPTATGLAAVGSFVSIGGTTASRIARWNGLTWDALDEGLTGSATGAANSGFALAEWDGDLWAGGNTLIAGTRVSPFLARWTDANVGVVRGPGAGGDGSPAILEFSAQSMPGTGTQLVGRFATPVEAEVAVFDAAGRKVATLARGTFTSGRHIWGIEDQGQLPSGLYFARLRAVTESGVGQRVAKALVLH